MPKPKILCLHGAGSNARIFSAQTARLNLALEPHFDLVYPDAPIECAAGPGILPIFEGEEPFRRWHRERDEVGGDAAQHAAQMERVRLLLVGEVAARGPFAGVLGFSQGAKTALQLLLLQEEEALDVGVGFGVFVCGTTPPEDLLAARRKEGVEAARVVRVPTVHVIADADPWRAKSEDMPAYCDRGTTKVFRFKGGHHMPTVAADNQKLAELILGAYREAEAQGRGC